MCVLKATGRARSPTLGPPLIWTDEILAMPQGYWFVDYFSLRAAHTIQLMLWILFYGHNVNTSQHDEFFNSVIPSAHLEEHSGGGLARSFAKANNV